ncbi:MAG: substrate-binding domain-containing protein [Faecalibacterium prausnitzii]
MLTTLVTDELDFPNLSMVGVDDRAAAYTAVDYLDQAGHRKIAVFGGRDQLPQSDAPSGRTAMPWRMPGILFNDQLYGLSNYDFESAYHAMNSLLARRAEFTALFAMSDVIAFRRHPGAGERRAAGAGGCFGDSALTASRCPLLRAGDDLPSSSPASRSRCKASSCWCGRSSMAPLPEPSTLASGLQQGESVRRRFKFRIPSPSKRTESI